MSKGSIKKYQDFMKEKYKCQISEDNYKECILNEFSDRKFLKKYFQRYISKNSKKLDLTWGVLMFLFIKASEEKNVTAIEEYIRLLNKYPDNYFVEYILGDIDLMYYGRIFHSRDRFLKAIILKENDANSYYNLGFIYNLLGSFEKSLEYFNKAIYYSDNAINQKELKSNALYNIAIYYITVDDDVEKAEEILEEILKEDSNYTKAINTLRRMKGDI
ncbi:tetratricopeptide repeat protein [Clostridium rectalis]|uniref:tetratricopeptide repeat protein n=1 Tax=Clostridium rectalis TaxID=2040295 RepID=UPI000F63862A|nr:tetratricopeptide repeat protein [Clostridium rectalis]